MTGTHIKPGFMYLEVTLALVLMVYIIHIVMASYTAIIATYTNTYKQTQAISLAIDYIQQWQAHKLNPSIQQRADFTFTTETIKFSSDNDKVQLPGIAISVLWKDAYKRKQVITLYASRKIDAQ